MDKKNSNVRQVIVMRTDLQMRKGKMIAQGAHASMKVLLDRGDIAWTLDPTTAAKIPWFEAQLDSAFHTWITGIFTKICVRADSEAHLLDIYEKAKTAQLPCSLIQDAGLTEFKEPTYTCCAIGPADKSDLDPITGGLKLL